MCIALCSLALLGFLTDTGPHRFRAMFAPKIFKPWLLVCLAFATLFSGCDNPPSLVLPDLRYPVAVLYGKSSVMTFKDANDLSVMYVNSVLSRGEDSPTLIDSDFVIYSMNGLRSTHGGLWLMANPAGGTSVYFKLEPATKSGIDAARELLRAQLDLQTWRDLEKARHALAKEKTLAGMVKVVNETPQ